MMTHFYTLSGLVRNFSSLSQRFLLLAVLLGGVFQLGAQCTFTSNGPFAIVAEDTDDDTAPFSYAQGNPALDAALGAIVDVTSPASIRICFWGDMNAANETFVVNIAGLPVGTVGDLGFTPSQASPYCQVFIVADLAALEADLADGDIDITYNGFSGGWDNLTGSGNQFNAQVVSITFDYDVPVNMGTPPANQCQDGTNIDYNATPVNGVGGGTGAYSIFPASAALNTTTGVLDVSAANPGMYNVVYQFTVNGCTFENNDMVEVFATPVANIQDTEVECLTAGQTIDLNIMFDGLNTGGGTWTLNNGVGSLTGSTYTPAGAGGCADITYTAPNPNGCGNGPYTSTASLLTTVRPEPMFTLASAMPSPVCSDGGTVAVTLTPTSTGDNQVFTIDGGPATAGVNNLNAPAGPGFIGYEICLTETSTGAACGGLAAPTPCVEAFCTTFSIFNDGNGCGANSFPSECPPDSDATDVCPIDVTPTLDFGCSFFNISGPTVITAEITNEPGGLGCNEEDFDFNWESTFGGLSVAGGPTISELNPVTGVICAIITFEFCIPLPFVDDLCIDPIPLGDFEDACDQTIGQFIATTVGTLVGGGGGSGLIVADTDGDGNFDQVLATYDYPDAGTVNDVPNNIDGSGIITVRHVVSWPFDAESACGNVNDGQADLLELLPIGAIPLVGPQIEDILATAGCNVNLSFSAEKTVEIPVINSSPPEFANCNTAGYQFSEDGICDTEANWAIPVAYDGCNNEVLAYRGHTAGVDVTNFNGTAPAIVVEDQSGLYQTAGPLPGSDLAPGTYEVTYTAYSCSGIPNTCTFPVIVTTGDPMLACPGTLDATSGVLTVTLKADADDCDAVVTGLAPIQGISCASVINYSITFADGTTASTTTAYSLANRGTHNDASGLVYLLGTNVVTYTMMVDINGDGDADDTIDGVEETQTCTFNVVIIDSQRPVAECIDVEVKLDNTGNVMVFAEDQVNGSAFADGGSTDNCDTDLAILIAKAGETPAASIIFDCTEVGYNLVTLQVTDDANNVSTCISQVYVEDFFEGITFDLDIPEICLEDNNPSQLDFSNYLIITLPDGTTLSHAEVAASTYLGEALGAFGITALASENGLADPGTISTDGVYTPGTASGFVTVSYALALPNAVVQNNNAALTGCFELVHSIFELRQPLDMLSPECECIVQNDRIVNLGFISGGLEPYTIQYGGVKLDVDGDFEADDVDGEYTYDAASGADIGDFTQVLGNLLVDYTQPTWFFTVVDARGCELFRSGSCDNDDETGTPEIDCTALGAVTIYTRNEPACEVQDTWTHTLPTDNCDVILYTYTIENPDGTIAGPFDLTALLNPDITNPLPDQFIGEYDFEHHSPTENVSTITYYAEDAVGNFSQCEFTVTVIDDDAPQFINCPEPAVIIDAQELHCDAFANYSLPLAEDNCGTVVVTQVDDTGLTSGDLYPVGITINTFEAVDETGNTTRCDVKIIVNDYRYPVTIECPDDVVAVNDEGDCGAVVNNIAPSGITDNCIDNITVIYRIDDEDGNELSSGLDDASGTFFDLGTSTVSYAVQDMPMLLITEVTHEYSNTVDGAPVTALTCFDGILNGDETGIDCGGSSCTPCICDDNQVDVEIVLDGFPEQTVWTITEPNNGAVLATGGPYAAALAGTTVSDNVCLPDGCYDFVITDTGLDGLAAGGSYTVSIGEGVLASGGVFGEREVTNFCLDGTQDPASLTGTAGLRDALEITNFGSIDLDISSLMIERIYAGGSEILTVPTGAILAPGGVLTIHFGDGHDDLANNIFNVPAAVDLAIDEPTAYVVSLSRSILDILVINDLDISGLMVPAYNLNGLTVADYWSGTVSPLYGGGVVRTTVWDTDTATDFAPGEACAPITIGFLNPSLPQPTPSAGSTAIQAQPTVRTECTPFTVTISDNEPATCGLYSDYTDYETGPISIGFGDCVETTIINIPEDLQVADINLTLQGTLDDLGNLTVTLISPEGTAIDLIEAICGGSSDVDVTLDGDADFALTDNCNLIGDGEILTPVGDIEAFNGESTAGDWVIQIGHNGQESMGTAEMSNVILSISSREDYTQGNEDLENDFRLCGAEFTWLQAVLFDNCAGGSVLEELIFDAGTPDSSVLRSDEIGILELNTETTFFFPVGTTTVRYTLTDAAGNTSSCEFEVLVRDTENPVLTCPSDTTLQLASGACEIVYIPTDYTAEDNCAVTEIFSVPDFNDPLPIGVTEVDFTIRDAAGNDTTCTYVVTVLENIPMPPVMACITNINIHLDQDCEQEIIPEMVLTGNDFFCFDEYDILLLQENAEGGQDTLPGMTVGTAQVGETVIYQISEERSGAPCWGYIEVGFFNAPEFICPADTTVSCNGDTDVNSLGSPVLLSCALAGATVAHADTLERFDRCDDPRAILRRTWLVTDNFGNSASCVQTITIEAFDLDIVRFPSDFDDVSLPALNCVEVANDESLTDPTNTGFPFVEQGNDIFGNSFCSASYLYTDEVFNICAGSYEIIRTWKVRNTCMPVIPGVNPIESIQIIRVLDNGGPQFECPADETISTGPFDCNGAYVIPTLDITAGCSNASYIVTVSGGELNQLEDGTYVLSGLEIGSYTIQYEVEDECGNFNSCQYNLTVNDQVTATAICEDGLNVSLNTNGVAALTAADVDGGSDDLCGNVDLAIRREYNFDPITCDAVTAYFSDWGPLVDVNCCDLAADAMVTVELRVTDEDGNVSTCWTDVLIEDKLAPVCAPPQPMQVSCLDLSDDFPENLTEAFNDDPVTTEALLNDLFGTAIGIDNCGEATVTQTVVDGRTDCGTGSIFRRFTVTDEQGLVAVLPCTQTIEVTAVQDYTIEFPADRSSSECVEPDFAEVTYTDLGCGFITTSTSIDTFEATADECYKLRVTYEMINWCEYDSESDAYLIPRDADNDNNLEESTFLHILERGDAEVAVLDRDANRDNNTFIAFLDFQDEGTIGLPATLLGTQEGTSASNGYHTDPSRGFFRYHQFIKVYDDVAPSLVVDGSETEFCDEEGDCLATAVLTFSVDDLCSPDAITATVTLDANINTGADNSYTLADFVADGGNVTGNTVNVGGSFTTTLADLPFGTHAIRIVATDGCGNTAIELIAFEVNDCTAPTPICINGLTATLMPNGQGGGMAAIWADDFIASAVSDCSGEVEYAIYRSAFAADQDENWAPSIDDTGVDLTCDDEGMLAVRIYAIDPAGQFDYCETTLFVQVFQEGVCAEGTVGSIAGLITAANTEAMTNVTVNITDAAQVNASTTTDAGFYQFGELELGRDYTVQPDYNPAPNISNISTGDLVMITRHILGIQALENVYQVEASDVTRDGNTNVVDIIAIRRLILGLTENFPATPSWQFFVAGDANMAQVQNINNLSGNVTGVDYVGVEMGNVSGATAGLQGMPEGRSSLELSTPDLELKAGNTYEVVLSAAGMTGFQGTLELAPGLEVTGLEFAEGASAMANLNEVASGLVAMSFIADNTADRTEEAAVATLMVRATVDGKLSEFVSLSDRITTSEGYTDTETTALGLDFKVAMSAKEFRLEQNTPNPFTAATTISFLLPESGLATLKFQNIQGQVMLEREIEASAGMNVMNFTKADFKGVTGVMTYTLTAGEFTATRKMILQ